MRVVRFVGAVRQRVACALLALFVALSAGVANAQTDPLIDLDALGFDLGDLVSEFVTSFAGILLGVVGAILMFGIMWKVVGRIRRIS